MVNKNKDKKVFVIGAGMSGMATALRLQELGVETTVIEKNNFVGGLAGSFSWDEFKNLDFGPHIYHTPDKKLENFWKFEYGDLFFENEFWGKNVKGKNFYEFFDYPLSFESLKQFPEKTRKKILFDLGHLDNAKLMKARSYSDYVTELVGPTLLKMFFVKYPEKLWGISVEDMTPNWAPKRINFRRKNEHFHSGQWSAVGKYGSGKILEAMADKFKKKGGKLLLGKAVTNIEHSTDNIKALVLNGKEKIKIDPSDAIVSTMPMSVLAEHFNIKNSLKYRGAKLVFAAVEKSEVIPGKTNFLYYDADDVIFHRVSEQKKFCDFGFPKNKTVLTMEIAYSAGEKNDGNKDDKIITRAKSDLVKVGLVKKSEIYDSKLVSLPYVYPIQTKGLESEIAKVRNKLASFRQLYLIGTGGDFHYADLQILHIKGYDLAERLASEGLNESRLETKKWEMSYGFNREVALGKKMVGNDHPPFIIAEIGLNHNGSVKLAMELIDKAVEAGCGAVKFQTYSATNRISKAVKDNRYAEKLIDVEESVYDMLHRLELSEEEHKQLFSYARRKGIEIFSTPFDIPSVDLLESLGVKFYKVASMDLVNLPLIKKVASTGKPMIISTGMSTLDEIEDALSVVWKEGNKNVVLLHCVSSYPAAPEVMNLRVMENLGRNFRVPVGLSDHSIGLTAGTIALSMGAKVIERHFTLDRFMEGPDHILSSDFPEMEELVRLSHLIPVIQGNGDKKIEGSELEVMNRFKKCLYAKKNIDKGQKITADKISIKGPSGGILPKHIGVVIGKIAKKQIPADHPILWESI